MFCGVIEGFYGKAWSWQERRSMIDFLSENGFSSYVYAPKADGFLRNQWQQDWPAETFSELQNLAQYAKDKQIDFGVGLSPISLLEQWGDQQVATLRQRLQQIAKLQPNTLAILFDDVQGDKQYLASRQAEVLQIVAESLPETRLIMCPSYYSFDPILPEIFGAMPDNYWQQLSELLPQSIGILWTGDKVISDDYPAASLQEISQLLQRKPIIWDNSRVNDGRKTSPFIPIKPMFKLSALEGLVNGVLINPMNQPDLAKINLLSLQLEGSEQERLEAALSVLAPQHKAFMLERLNLLNDVGLEDLKADDKQLLEGHFESNFDEVSEQVKKWLNGDYRFDPSCLT